MSKGFASNPRIALLAGAVFLSFGGLAFQLVNLQVLRRDELVQYVEKSRQQVRVEKGQRGDILDARGAKLATSVTEYNVGVDPRFLKPLDEDKWDALAGLLKMPLADVRRILTTKYRSPGAADAEDADDAPDGEGPVLSQWNKLKEGVDKDTYDQIADLHIAGVRGDRVFHRSYPQGPLAAHILGFVNKAEVPAAGVEHFSDFFLRGRDGWSEGEKDARGRELAQFQTRDVAPVNGYNVRLSLDSFIQSMVEKELASIAAAYDPLKATIIVSDAQTGFILGFGNYPTFDPNNYGKATNAQMRNVGVADIYDPGSVFKIVAASAALEEGRVTPASTFNCTADTVVYKGQTYELPDEDHNFDHSLSVAEIISHSSNRGAVQLAMSVGENKFYQYARAFGFGAESGFPVGGESAGILAPVSKWQWSTKAATFTRIPMGQSVSVTVLQMHQAMSIIAAHGLLLKPQIVSEIDDADGTPLYRYQPQEVRRVISEKTAATMARLLMGVAHEGGTAPLAEIPYFQVGGKTGTTQKLIDGHYSTEHHVASFVGFFPATRPQVVISVIVDDADAKAKGGTAYGGQVAAPAFKHLAQQIIQYREIKPVLEGGPSVALQGGRSSFAQPTEGRP